MRAGPAGVIRWRAVGVRVRVPVRACGSASKQMPKDVKATLASLLASFQSVDEPQGEALLAELTRAGRFQEECWG